MSKRILAVLLTLILLLGLAACGGATSSAPPAATSAGGTEDPAPSAAAEAEEITVFFTKGGFDPPPDNDIIKQAIEEGSGVKFTQIAPPIANYNEQVALQMASKDLPDVIKFNRYTDLFLYQSQGALAELDELMNLMPNVKEAVPQAALDLCTIDGSLYSVPIWTSEKRYNNVIRGDWLDKLGFDVPVTLEDFEEIYVAVRDQDPDGNGVADTYGIGGVAANLELFEAVMGAFGVMSPTRGYFKLDDGEFIHMAVHPQMKECLEYLARLYKEKMIDPDWATITTEPMLNEVTMKNRQFAVHKWWTWEPKMEVEMTKVDPNVRFDRIGGPEGPYGRGVRGVPIVNVPICILSTSDKKEAAARFIDFYHTELGMMTAYSGVEGVHWEKRDDGKYYNPGPVRRGRQVDPVVLPVRE